MTYKVRRGTKYDDYTHKEEWYSFQKCQEIYRWGHGRNCLNLMLCNLKILTGSTLIKSVKNFRCVSIISPDTITYKQLGSSTIICSKTNQPVHGVTHGISQTTESPTIFILKDTHFKSYPFLLSLLHLTTQLIVGFIQSLLFVNFIIDTAFQFEIFFALTVTCFFGFTYLKMART